MTPRDLLSACAIAGYLGNGIAWLAFGVVPPRWLGGLAFLLAAAFVEAMWQDRRDRRRAARVVGGLTSRREALTRIQRYR